MCGGVTIYAHIYICIYIFLQHIYTDIYMYIFIYMYTYIHIYIQTHTYIYMYTYAYIYINYITSSANVCEKIDHVYIYIYTHKTQQLQKRPLQCAIYCLSDLPSCGKACRAAAAGSTGRSRSSCCAVGASQPGLGFPGRIPISEVLHSALAAANAEGAAEVAAEAGTGPSVVVACFFSEFFWCQAWSIFTFALSCLCFRQHESWSHDG